MDGKDLVRGQFTKRAGEYAGGIFSDPHHLDTIVGLSGVKAEDTVLDIATGGGYLALEFARRARYVTGIDLTPKMLENAELLKAGSGLDNVKFRTADVEALPFDDGAFDIVSCRFAFHHFPDPEKALSEMARVLKKGGRLVLVDGTSSEDPEKSTFLNIVEKMRDPSHIRLYPLSRLKGMLKERALTTIKVKHWPLDQVLTEWLQRAGPARDIGDKIKELMLGSLADDGTGLDLRMEKDRLVFTYDTVILVAMK